MHLAGLWALAALLVGGAAASILGYATLLPELLDATGPADDSAWQQLNALSILTMPLLAAGLLIALIALATHAALWSRKRATPQEP